MRSRESAWNDAFPVRNPPLLAVQAVFAVRRTARIDPAQPFAVSLLNGCLSTVTTLSVPRVRPMGALSAAVQLL